MHVLRNVASDLYPGRLLCAAVCLAFPGKIIEIKGSFGKIDFGGGTIKDNINISFVEAKVGRYVLVHAGFAIEVIDEEEARKIIEFSDQYLSELTSERATSEKQSLGGLT